MKNELLNHLKSLSYKQYKSLLSDIKYNYKGENSNVYVYNSSYNTNEIIIPKNKQIKDLNYIMNNLFNILVHENHISPERLLSKLTETITDEVKIRVIHNDVKNGSIPIDDGIRLIEGGKDLAFSAASSVIKKSANYNGNSNSIVKDYMNNLRLGQTEIGSYIINISSDIIPEKKNTLFPLEPFSRTVSKQIIGNLETLLNVVEEYKICNKLEIFDDNICKGISSNLCKSILSFGGGLLNRDINLNIKIQDSLITKDINKVFFIDHDSLPIIKKGYEHLLDNNIIEKFEAIGFVIKLSRDEELKDGEISILSNLEGNQRKIKAVLNELDYEIAIMAHQQHEKIIIEGDLKKEGRRLEIINIKSVLFL